MSLKDWILKRLPTRSVRRFLDIRQEPSAVAHTMDVDRLGSILRSAEAGNMEDFFSLARDIIGGHSHVQAEFSKRKLAVIGDELRLEPYDKDNPEDVAVAEALEANLENLDELLDVLLHLLDSTIYPVAVVEKIYRPSAREGWLYELAELRPVPHRLLDWSEGEMRIWDTDERGNKLATRHAPDPVRYIVARIHPLTNLPDTWGGPMRAVVFWWLFSVMDRHWWARFLDRFGAPFMVAKYDEADDAARSVLSLAFQTASKVFGLAVPRSVEIELEQASTQGAGEAFAKFHEVANRELSKVIVGQTLSAEGQNLGLGGGQASVQESVRQDIRQFDSRRLGHILRTQLLLPLRTLNHWTGRAPTPAWGAESPAELTAIGSILPGLANAGVELTDEGIDELSGRLGFGLRRVAAAPPPERGLGLAAPLAARAQGPGLTAAERRSDAGRAASDSIARHGAPELAEALRDSLAPVAKILAASDSLEDFEARLRARFPDLPSRRAASILEAALVANATNAVLNHRDPATP